jgi:outer membrane biosynthesis protein TonB
LAGAAECSLAPAKALAPEGLLAAGAGGMVVLDERARAPGARPVRTVRGPSPLRYGAVVAVLLVLIGLVLFNPFGRADSGQASEPPPATPETVSPSTTEPTPTQPPTPARTPEPSETPTPAQTLARTTVTSPTPAPEVSPTSSQSSTEPTMTAAPGSPAVTYTSCAEVRAAGKAPLHRGDPGYSRELDRNGDGVACDHGNS